MTYVHAREESYVHAGEESCVHARLSIYSNSIIKCINIIAYCYITIHFSI